MKTSKIRATVRAAAAHFSLRRVTLFGSQANGTATEKSDVDLLVEFSAPVTLLTLASLRDCLEELLGVPVDIVHGPLRSTDLLEIESEVPIYAA